MNSRLSPRAAHSVCQSWTLGPHTRFLFNKGQSIRVDIKISRKIKGQVISNAKKIRANAKLVSRGAPLGQKRLWHSKEIFFPKMLEMMYKTDVYIGVLLSDPPFLQKSRIQGSKNLNWRKRLRLRPRETYVYHPIRNAMLGLWFFPSEIGSKEPRKLDFSSGRSRTSSFTFSKNWNFTKFLVIFWRIFCRRLDTPCHSPMKFEW